MHAPIGLMLAIGLLLGATLLILIKVRFSIFSASARSLSGEPFARSRHW